MEFHGTARVNEIGALLVPWNSIEFHGTARVSEIGALHGALHGTASVSSMEFNGTYFFLFDWTIGISNTPSLKMG